MRCIPIVQTTLLFHNVFNSLLFYLISKQKSFSKDAKYTIQIHRFEHFLSGFSLWISIDSRVCPAFLPRSLLLPLHRESLMKRRTKTERKNTACSFHGYSSLLLLLPLWLLLPFSSSVGGRSYCRLNCQSVASFPAYLAATAVHVAGRKCRRCLSQMECPSSSEVRREGWRPLNKRRTSPLPQHRNAAASYER